MKYIKIPINGFTICLSILLFFFMLIGIGVAVMDMFGKDVKDECPQGYTCEKIQKKSGVCWENINNQSELFKAYGIRSYLSFVWSNQEIYPIWSGDIEDENTKLLGFKYENGTEIPRCEE